MNVTVDGSDDGFVSRLRLLDLEKIIITTIHRKIIGIHRVDPIAHKFGRRYKFSECFSQANPIMLDR